MDLYKKVDKRCRNIKQTFIREFNTATWDRFGDEVVPDIKAKLDDLISTIEMMYDCRLIDSDDIKYLRTRIRMTELEINEKLKECGFYE
jgi:hypothetical protein